MLISASPNTIHCARYFPAPPPCAMPKLVPQQCQKFFRPTAGPNRGPPSGVCGIAPLTKRRRPTSPKIGIRSIARSSHGAMRSRSSGNNSLVESHSGFPPRGAHASARPVFSYTPISPLFCSCRKYPDTWGQRMTGISSSRSLNAGIGSVTT